MCLSTNQNITNFLQPEVPNFQDDIEDGARYLTFLFFYPVKVNLVTKYIFLRSKTQI